MFNIDVRATQSFVIGFLVCLAAPAAFGQVVANGSMTGPVQIGSPPPSWTSLSVDGDTIGPGGFMGWATGMPASTNGGTFLALLNNGGGGSFDSAGQIISGFTAGQTYTLKFEYANAGLDPSVTSNYNNSGFIRATIAGVNLDSPILLHNGFGTQQWFQFGGSFVATASTLTLQFEPVRLLGGGYAAAVDGVTIVSSSGAPYCFGDGTGLPCPCLPNGNPGGGCLNTSGSGALLAGSGIATFPLDTFQLTVTGAPALKAGLILRGAAQVNGGLGLPIGDGLLCTGSQTARSQVQVTSASGMTTFTQFQGFPFSISSYGPGLTANYQFWYRDPGSTCTGQGFNFSNAWQVCW